MKTRLARWIATWFGCGYAPAGPGTVGSLAAVLIAWALARWAMWSPWAICALGVIVTAPAIWAADVTARAVGRKDPGIVVVDEVVGQWITFAGAAAIDWTTLIAAFILFRLFDIWKPPPVRQLERFHGGLGIVLDDVFAGVYAAVLLFAISRLTIRH
jgi:phosphatidylglycerophosphatase A